MLKRVIEAGATKSRLVAKMAGGAKMFEVSGGAAATINVGERNAEAVKKKLGELGIKIIASDTGLNYGRTVVLDCNNGDFIIKAVGKELKTI